MDRFDAAVPSYATVVLPLSGYLAHLAASRPVAPAAAPLPTAAEEFASWGGKKDIKLAWATSVRPDAGKELDTLRSLFALETSQTNTEKAAAAADADAPSANPAIPTPSSTSPAPPAPASKAGKVPSKVAVTKSVSVKAVSKDVKTGVVKEGVVEEKEKVVYQEGHFHYKVVTVLLQCCCSVVAVLLRCCCSVVAVLLRCCCRVVAVLLQGCYIVVTRWLHYQGCKHDTEADHRKSDCSCGARIRKHTDILSKASKASR
jgi:hypothetical protein